MPKFAVAAGYMTDVIYVGRVGKNGSAFTQKEEATDMVLAAVAEYVMCNFGDGFKGGMEATFPRLNLRLKVLVEPLDTSVSGNEDES